MVAGSSHTWCQIWWCWPPRTQPEGADDVWLGVSAIAVGILSPREDEAAKLADFRAVIGAGHLRLREVWYIDAEASEVRLYEAATGQRLARSRVVPGADIPGIVFGPTGS